MRDDVLEMRHRALLERKLRDERDNAEAEARIYHEHLAENNEVEAAAALDAYTQHVRNANELQAALGINQQSNKQNDGLHDCERQWLAANPDYVSDPSKSAMLTGYVNALVASGMHRGSDEIMRAVEQKFGKGDGLPSDAEMAKVCGISLEEYERGKQRLAVLKSQGHYQEGQH
jgi:hypothetical protein